MNISKVINPARKRSFHPIHEITLSEFLCADKSVIDAALYLNNKM